MTKAKTLAAIHPNVGIEASYRKKLDKLIDEMNASFIWWIKAAYRANSPEMAQDGITVGETEAQEIARAIRAAGSPAKVLQNVMRKLSRKWQKKFDEAAPELANYFSTSVSQRVDGALTSILKKAGIAVEFKLTAMQNDVVRATVAENVKLISNIATEHAFGIEQAVMRSVTKGRDLAGLAKELESRYKITKRRAALIARDQNNKATAAINRVRQREAGITHAIWMHSHGGKHPRKSHQDYSGKEYEIDKGAYIDKEWIFPGEKINCRCVSKPVLPKFISTK